MPELKEVFDMVTKQTEPDLDSWREQERRHRQAARNRRVGAIAVVAAIAVVLAIFALNARDFGEEKVGTDPTEPPSAPIGAQIIGLDGTVVEELPDRVSLGEQPQLSPDGTTIAFYRGDAVWTMASDGTGARALTGASDDVEGAKNAVSWSPTGDELAYAWNGEIYVMNADGSAKRQLTQSPPDQGSYAPTWSPDGIAIAYWQGTSVIDNDAPDDSEIYVIGPGGGLATRLTRDDHASFQPAWSADGSQIAFRRHSPDDIVVMNADGTDAHVVTPGPLNPWSPAWSPDGTRIAFLRCCSDHESLDGRPLLEVAVLELASGQIQKLGVYVQTENNVPQWVSNNTLMVNRYE